MLPCEVWDRLGALRQEEMLAVLAAFFCLLFFAAAKKSRCRPAQGRRLKHEGITRMPVKRQTHRATLEARRHNADASEKAHRQGGRLKHESNTRMPATKPANHPASQTKKPDQVIRFLASGRLAAKYRLI